MKRENSSPTHNPKSNGKSNSKRKEIIDDAAVVIETVVEEATGVGVVRRLLGRAKEHVSREYLKRIEKLIAQQDELMRSNRVLARAGEDYMLKVDELELEIKQLKAELKKNHKQLKNNAKK